MGSSCFILKDFWQRPRVLQTFQSISEMNTKNENVKPANLVKLGILVIAAIIVIDFE